MPKKYRKLLKAQKLIRQREQALLNSELYEEQRLKEEQEALLQMREKPVHELKIDPLWISAKLARTSSQRHLLIEGIATKRKQLRQADKRCDILKEKYNEVHAKEMRKAMSFMVSEYIAIKRD